MKLNVNLPNHPYEIIIERGSLDTVGAWVASLWKPQKIMLISDNHVNQLYGEKVLSLLSEAGFDVSVFEFPEGEASKVLATAEDAWNFAAENGMTRSDGIIALGGGVTGDLAGFVASTYMRGIHFLQIPTSLTAQVDSSIGGKTGINSSVAKNMIGTFTQPDGVLIDPDVLSTLGVREFKEGLGEVIKCGLIGDKKLWELLEKAQDISDLRQNHAEEIIFASCDVKRKVVVDDELDNGVRLFLNFGHTIGHAVESVAGYGKVMHGEAVAIGMVQISKIAEEKGLMPKGITEQIRQIIVKYGLPVEYEPWEEQKLFEALTHDKKARGKLIKTVIVPEIGRAAINPVSFEEMKDYLRK